MADRPASATRGRAAAAASGRSSSGGKAATTSGSAKGKAAASKGDAVPDPTKPSSSSARAADARAAVTSEERVPVRGLAKPFSAGFLVTLGGLLAFALGFSFLKLSTVVIYIAFALFVALGLDPLVRFLGRHGIARVWAIVIVYAAFAIVFIGMLLLIIPTLVAQISQVVTDAPQIVSDFEGTDLYAFLNQQFGSNINDLLNQVETFLTNPANLAAIGGGALQVGETIASTISGIIIVIVLSLYFLSSLDAMERTFVRLVPARSRDAVAAMTGQIATSIGAYLQGMVVLAFANAVVALVLHLVLGLPFPVLLAVVAFAITLIPLVGSVLYWILATVIALFTSPLSALIFAVVYLIYMQLEAYVLTPRVMNKAVSVPGSLVVIGALVGGTLLGLLGALIAIPVTASFILIVKQVWIPRQDAKT